MTRLPRPAVVPTLRLGIPAALALASLVGCGERDGAPRAGAPDTLAAEAGPLIDPSSVRVREVFRLTATEAGRADLRQPRDIAFDVAGRLIALDVAPPDHRQIVAFDSSGTFATRFGALDDRADRVGPSDQFAVTPWNYVMFVDAAENALTSFLTLGTYVSTVTLQGIGMAVEPITEYGHFYLKKWDPPRRRAYVVHVQLPADSVSMVYQVALPPGQSVRKDARDVGFLTATDRDGRLYVAFSDVYRVRVLDRQGATVRVIESARPAVRKSPRELEEERERTLTRLRGTLAGVSDSLIQEAARPDSLFALVEELVVDPAGRLWVRTHRSEASGGTAYDVFNERGEPISWVAIPAVVRKSAFASDGRLFVIDERDPERPTVLGYEIEFGGRGSASVTPSGPGEPRSLASGR